MDNYKKQILQRVIDFYIEKSDADKKTIRTVACLMNDIEAINYTRCCETLKDKYPTPIWTWLNVNYKKKGNKYSHNISKELHSLDELLIYYDETISKI